MAEIVLLCGGYIGQMLIYKGAVLFNNELFLNCRILLEPRQYVTTIF